ncbi:MAG TPA: lysylphosphatidylglycerol synthase transmembrane domain-containing protein [Candidatus Eisenbacteria bacterium]|nr:lysylphosphatidylglycerol synthase transmembrane domain-containing protein [Candidatus Eisenbacteria bacterium]
MTSRPTSESKKWVLITLLVLLAGYLLYRSGGLLGLSGFSAAKLWAAIRGANPLWLVVSMLLIYGCYALRSLRWQVFQRNLGRAKFWEIYPTTLAGFASVFLLGRAGEPIRPLLLAKRAKHPVADIFGIWVLERLFDVASMAVIAAIALIVFKGSAHSGEAAETIAKAARTAGAVLAIGVGGAIAFLIYLRLHGTTLLETRLQGWRDSSGWRSGLAKIVLGFITGIQTVRSAADLFRSVVYSAIHWFLVLVVYYCVAQSFGGRLAELSLGDCMLVLAFTLVGSAVQLPAVGGGSQALAIFAFTKVFGVDAETAVAAAIVLWLITFAGCAVAGIPLLIREGVSLGQLREMAEHEKEELKEIAAHASTIHEKIQAGGKGE